jgi:hypothetical protein
MKNTITFLKGEPRWDLEKLHAQRQEAQDAVEENLDAIKCESGNVRIEWNDTVKCMLDTESDVV